MTFLRFWVVEPGLKLLFRSDSALGKEVPMKNRLTLTLLPIQVIFLFSDLRVGWSACHTSPTLWLNCDFHMNIKEGETQHFKAIPSSSLPAPLLNVVRLNLIQETLTRLLLQVHSCGLDLLGQTFKLSGHVCPDSSYLKSQGAFLWTWTIHTDASRLIEFVFKLGSVYKGNPTKIARWKLLSAQWNFLRNSFPFVSPQL